MASARTSLSHPLQIASVSPGEGWGQIGITFCPGKKQPGAMTGAWDRDLGLDVEAIAAWGTSTVVTLVEQHELASLGVVDLGKAVEAAHMSWVHLPLRDVSVPGPAFEQQWTRLGPLLRAQLQCGFNIVVHCKGGLGRAGTIASRLLIDADMAPADALAAVRLARPGAVETSGQERYVLDCVPLPPATPSGTTEAIADRAVGAFLGLAIGDALGTTLEFTRRDAQPRVTDLVGGGPFGLQPGEWTDDTAMALAFADSLAADPMLNEKDLMDRFVDWYRRGTTSCTGRCFDIGGTTRAALTSFEHTGNPVAGATDPFSAGNGSLMRLAPVALRYWNNRDRLADVAVRQSATTHGAAEAVSACLAFAHILADAIEGKTREDVLTSRELDVAVKVGQVIGGSWRGKSRHDIRSSGYVIDSLEAAIWCVARTAGFANAVILAANLGDDADTVAAITGQLAGALYGASAIPPEWMAKLAWRERLEAAARALLR